MTVPTSGDSMPASKPMRDKPAWLTIPDVPFRPTDVTAWEVGEVRLVDVGGIRVSFQRSGPDSFLLFGGGGYRAEQLAGRPSRPRQRRAE